MRIFRKPGLQELRTLAKDTGIESRSAASSNKHDDLWALRRQKTAAAR